VLHLDALSDEELVEICRGTVPIVIINRLVSQLEAQSVYSDDELGGRLATQYLIANGHRRIACMTGPLSMHESRERLHGYEAVLREYGVAVDPGLIVESTFTVDGGYCAALSFLLTKGKGDGITAIFSQNDQMALGIFNACHELRLAVPQDISVVGFDDIEWARYLNPALTTVRQHVREMGMAAGRCLMRALGRDARRDGAPDELITRFEPELIVRESVRSRT
jgi:LacI family transcriptional regulator